MVTERQKEREEFKRAFNKRLIHFTVDTLTLCRSLRDDRSLWEVADQLSRSAASIGANVSEARGSSSMRGYKNYFEIAIKSAHETQYWFAVIREFQDGQNNNLEKLEVELNEIVKVLSVSVLTMRKKMASKDV